MRVKSSASGWCILKTVYPLVCERMPNISLTRGRFTLLLLSPSLYYALLMYVYTLIIMKCTTVPGSDWGVLDELL